MSSKVLIKLSTGLFACVLSNLVSLVRNQIKPRHLGFLFLFASSISTALTVNTANSANTYSTYSASITVTIPELYEEVDDTYVYDLQYQSPGSLVWNKIYGTQDSRGFNIKESYSLTLSTEGTHRYRYTKTYCEWDDDEGEDNCTENYSYGSTHTVNYTTTPLKPGSITLGSINNDAGNVTLSWPASSNATSYRLQISTNNGAWSTSYSGSSRSKSYTNLSSAMREFRVQACNGSACSDWRESSDLYIARKPGSLTENATEPDTNGGFQVSWGAPSGTVDSFQIQRRFAAYTSSTWGGWSTISTLGGTTRTLTQSGMVDGKWDYRVRSKRGSRYSGWMELSGHITVLRPPTTPTNIRILNKTDNTDKSFRAQWDSQSRRVTSYDLYRSSASYGSSSYGSETHIEKGTSVYDDETMSDGHHRYRVRACNEAGCSSLSGFVTTTILSKPSTPSNFRLLNKSGNTDKTFRIQWNSQSTRVTSYDLYRSTAAYGSSTYSSPQTHIEKGTSVYDDESMGDGHHRYRVRACNESGCSGYTGYIIATVLSKPGAPTTLSVSGKADLSDTTYAINWGAASGLVTSYRVYRKERTYSGSFGTESTYKTGLGSSVLSISENEGTGGYRYRAEACNESGCMTTGTIDVVVLETPSVPDSVSLNPANQSEGSFLINVGYGEGLQTHIEFQERVRDQGSSAWGAWIPTPSGSVSAYVMDASGSNDSFPMSRSAYTGTGLAEYQFQVRACHEDINEVDDRCSDWAPTGVYTVEPPGTPANLVLSGISDGEQGTADISDSEFLVYADDNGAFELEWDALVPASASNPALMALEITYKLEESTDAGQSWSVLTGNNFDSTLFAISSRADGAYEYRLRACANTATENIGCGDWTYPFGVDVRHRPSVPTGLGFLNSSGEPTTIAIDSDYRFFWDSAPTAETVTAYQYVEVLASNGDETGGEVDGSAVSRDFSSQEDDIYQYKVQACNYYICSEYSAIVSIDVLLRSAEVGVVYTQGGVAAENNQPFFSGGDGLTYIYWQAPASGQVDAYQVRVQNLNTGIWSNYENTGNSGQDQEWSSVLAEGEYKLRVRATNRLSSGPVKDRLVDVRIAPDQVENIDGNTYNFSGNFRLAWPTPAGTITHFEMETRKEDETWQDLYSGVATDVAVSGLEQGVHEFRVRACNEVNCSDDWSPIKTVSVGIAAVSEIQLDPAIHSVPAPPTESDQIGSINGSFRVNEGGGATYSIPMMSAPGVAGVSPGLSLNYSSQGGNGLLGLGWSLGGLSEISRCRQTLQQDRQALPITWGTNDRFCLDGQRLILTSGTYGGNNSTYNTEIDSFVEVTLYTDTNAPDYFVVERKDGSRSTYGWPGTSASEFKPNNTDDSAGSDILSWSIRRVIDSVGNPIHFFYANSASEGHRISEIRYAYDITTTQNNYSDLGNTGYGAKTAFAYDTAEEARHDDMTAYLSGRKFSRTARLGSISVYNDTNLLRKYNLNYRATDPATPTLSSDSHLSRLDSIEECADNNICLPATSFEWLTPEGFNKTLGGSLDIASTTSSHVRYTHSYGDLNGDGYQDLVWVETDGSNWRLMYSFFDPASHGFSTTKHQLRSFSLSGEYTIGGSVYRDSKVGINVVDYNADGRMDLLQWDTDQLTLRLYLSRPQLDGSWKLQLESTDILAANTYSNPFVADVNADGLSDLIVGKSAVYLLTRNSESAGSDTAYSYESVYSFNILNWEYEDRTGYDASDYPDDDTIDEDTSGIPPDEIHFKYGYPLAPAGDMNGDGIVDFYAHFEGVEYYTDDGINPEVFDYDYRGFGITQYSEERGWHLKRVWSTRHSSATVSTAAINHFRFADVNGDGLADYLKLNHTSSSTAPFQWQLRLSTGDALQPFIDSDGKDWLVAGTDEDDALAKQPGFADINGDGYQDIYWFEHSITQLKARFWGANNQGFGNPVTLEDVASFADDEWVYQLANIDADSSPDIVQISDNHNISVAINNSDSLSEPSNVIDRITNGLGAVTDIRYENMSASANYTRIEGIGTQQITHLNCDYGDDEEDYDCYQVPKTITDASEFYTTMNTPFEGVDALDTAETAPVLELFGPMPLVTRVESSSPSVNDSLVLGTDAKAAIEYFYEQAKVQAGGRGMLGFKVLRTIDQQTDTETSTQYRQDWPFIGSPQVTEVRHSGGGLLSQSSNRWELRSVMASTQDKTTLLADMKATLEASGSQDLGPVQPYLDTSTELTYDLRYADDIDEANDKVLSATVTHNQYDQWGNPSQIDQYRYPGHPNDSSWLLHTLTENSYFAGNGYLTARYGRLKEANVTTTKKLADGTLDDIQLRRSSFTYEPDYGLLDSETIHYLDTGSSQCTKASSTACVVDDDKSLITTYTHDNWGNRTSASQQDVSALEPARTSTTLYENNQGRYVSVTKNSLQQTTSEVIERNIYGVPTQVRGINGQSVRSAYSGMGRKYWEADATGGFSQSYLTSDTSSCPSGTAYKAFTKSIEGLESHQCFDTLGRKTRSRSLSFDGQWVNQDVQYDLQGRVARQSEPFTTVATHWTRFEYDLLGRVIQTTLPDNSSASATYEGLVTLTTNDLSHTRHEERDALGNMVRIGQNEGQGAPSERPDVEFEYDALGNLVKTTLLPQAGDTVGVALESTISYDGLGRKVAMDDVDKGAWAYGYNVFGEIVEQASANQPSGYTTVMGYDQLGRMEARIDYGVDGREEGATVWVYENDTGTDILGSRGQLMEVVYTGSHYRAGNALVDTDLHDVTETTTYDDYSRLLLATISLGDEGILGTFSSISIYDQYGRASKTISWDSLSQVPTDGHYATEITYNHYGYQESVTDLRTGLPLHKVIAMNARGQVTFEERNGATRTRYEYESATGQLCYKGTRKLTSADFSGTCGGTGDAGDSSDIQELYYQWDTLGNLQNRSDYSGSKSLTESFGYDRVNRLTSATVSGSSGKVVTYDSLGNIKTKSDVEGGASYRYGQNGAGAHAVTEVGGLTYAYDDNGNNISGDGRTLMYTSFDKVYQIDKGDHRTAFMYGPSRSRFMRLDENSSTGKQVQTLYVGSTEYRTDLATGALEVKRMVAGVMHTLHVDSGDTTETYALIFTDHLGSTDVMTDGLGNIVQEQSFDAWGARRDASNWTAGAVNFASLTIDGQGHSGTTQGFTGHEMLDDVGIIHMNGRIYDAKLGRFLQADPFIQFADYSQSYNRYSYGWNNPLNGTDPSGFVFGALVDLVVQAVYQIVPQKHHGVLNSIITITATIACGGNPACGATAAAYTSAHSAYAQTGSFSEAFEAGVKAGITSYVTSQAFSAIGRQFADTSGFFAKDGLGHIFAHGITGGVLAELQGGEFGHGFISAGLTKALTPHIQDTGLDAGGKDWGQVAQAAVIGGTASKLTGGKFSNGAITAAYGNLYNQQSKPPAQEEDFDGFVERDENGLVSGLDAPGVNSLEGGAGGSGSGFIGIAGVSLSGGAVSDGSKICTVATVCVQFGIGAYGGGGVEGSLSLSESQGLESGTYETWGFFGQGALGGSAGGSINFGDGAVGGARGFIGGGLGGAAGVQFCSSEVYCGD